MGALLVGIFLTGRAFAQEPAPEPTQQPTPEPSQAPSPAGTPAPQPMEVGDYVRLVLKDGRSFQGRVMALSADSVELRSPWMNASLPLVEIASVRVVPRDQAPPDDTVRCILTAPHWSLAPREIFLWADAGVGLGGTGEGLGTTGSVGVNWVPGGSQVLSLRWLTYADWGSWTRQTPVDHFDTFALLYGFQSRSQDLFAWGGAGPGYSSGSSRKDLLYAAPDGTQYFRPVQYSAVSLVARGFLGFSGGARSLFTVGVGATLDANPLRQSWGGELTLVYGSLPEAW